MTAAARTPRPITSPMTRAVRPRAEGDDVVPVAADRGVGAAGLVGGGDAQVVRLFEFLREQGALEGDGGLPLAALAGAQPLGRLRLVGDVGGEDEHAGLPVDGRAGHGEAAGVQVHTCVAQRADDWTLRDLTVRGVPLRRTWSMRGSRPSSPARAGPRGRCAGGRGPKAAM